MTTRGGPRPTIAFDWNGTLVDDLERACDATNEVLEPHRLPRLDPARFASAFRLPLRDFFGGLGVPVRGLGAAERAWNAAMARETPTLGAGATGLLRTVRARGYHSVVISAADRDVVRREAQELGILDYLDEVIGAAHPKSAHLSALVERSGGAVVLYVGDTEYDMAEAVTAGARPIGYSGGYRPADVLSAAGAELVVAHLQAVELLL